MLVTIEVVMQVVAQWVIRVVAAGYGYVGDATHVTEQTAVQMIKQTAVQVTVQLGALVVAQVVVKMVVQTGRSG